MLSGIALLAAVYLIEPGNTPLWLFCAALVVFVVYTHRGNIARMRAGQENRVRRLWLFRPKAA
jgi:glycerol-3-phosphate acyltransferase PlsY